LAGLPALRGNSNSSGPALAFAVGAQAAPATLILRHGDVWTVDAAHPNAEAVAIVGSTIVRVGSDAQVMALKGPATRVIDLHGALANMPGAVARTSTLALTNATLPFVIGIAEQGVDGALTASPHLRRGLNVAGGAIRHWAVAEALGLPLAA
jgi:Alanine dehydrogenase/PNT, C-terminal domain